MTEIKIVRTCKGSEDGFIVREFEEGKVYDVRRSLANSLIGEGWATITDEQLEQNWREMFEDETEFKCLIKHHLRSIRNNLKGDVLLERFNKLAREYGYE